MVLKSVMYSSLLSDCFRNQLPFTFLLTIKRILWDYRSECFTLSKPREAQANYNPFAHVTYYQPMPPNTRISGLTSCQLIKLPCQNTECTNKLWWPSPGSPGTSSHTPYTSLGALFNVNHRPSTPAQLCWRITGFHASHSHAWPQRPLIQISTSGLTSWTDLSLALLLWTWPVIIGPKPASALTFWLDLGPASSTWHCLTLWNSVWTWPPGTVGLGPAWWAPCTAGHVISP